MSADCLSGLVGCVHRCILSGDAVSGGYNIERQCWVYALVADVLFSSGRLISHLRDPASVCGGSQSVWWTLIHTSGEAALGSLPQRQRWFAHLSLM